MNGPMRHRIDSVNDCSRKGYNLRITCEDCGHVVEADTTLMMTELGPARAKWPLGRLEEKMKCSRCGERKSRIAPCAINFCSVPVWNGRAEMRNRHSPHDFEPHDQSRLRPDNSWPRAHCGAIFSWTVVMR